ncbi:hypothetical protein HPB49_017611 [Dermacentor silvarum]|uniref:Uncharacterized protein n=1 Tax=Dermacentor silvarum TaxID=543639 RepID=A0ACB8E1Z8_DERSI|nr:hypothetical protein HPB49_017611 [Dermacentor silvarum]
MAPFWLGKGREAMLDGAMKCSALTLRAAEGPHTSWGAEDNTAPTNARVEGVSASVKRSPQQDEKVDGKAGGESMKECLFLHCNVTGRPYRLEDFRDPLQELGLLKDVTGIGPFQITHVWLIKLRTPEAKEVLVNAGGLEVKGRFCAVIDPVQQDITLKVHWVPFHVTGEALKRTFDHYGEVKEV